MKLVYCTILKQEEDMSYPSLISSYDEWSFYKFMSSKKNDFKDCLSQIWKIPIDKRLFKNEENNKEFSAKDILTSFSLIFFMVDDSQHKASIETVKKMCTQKGKIYSHDFDSLLKKYRMKVVYWLHSVAGSNGRFQNFISKIRHYVIFDVKEYANIMKDYASSQEID